MAEEITDRDAFIELLKRMDVKHTVTTWAEGDIEVRIEDRSCTRCMVEFTFDASGKCIRSYDLCNC